MFNLWNVVFCFDYCNSDTSLHSGVGCYMVAVQELQRSVLTENGMSVFKFHNFFSLYCELWSTKSSQVTLQVL
ncbi:hypothetical protein Hdeb2414_s0015g00450881 [Helianthus debilis subsp. tardiflorus]